LAQKPRKYAIFRGQSAWSLLKKSGQSGQKIGQNRPYSSVNRSKNPPKFIPRPLFLTKSPFLKLKSGQRFDQ
jgi:hypothetical protein